MFATVLALALAASDAPKRYVVLPRARELYLAPSAKAAHVRDPELHDTSTLEEDFWVFARVGDPRDGWLPIASDPELVSDPYTPSRAGYHCYPGPPGLEGLRLRFFVRADAVSKVTRKRVTASFRDGSGVELLGGVAVGPRGQVALDGLRFKVPLAADALGDWYTPNPELFEPPKDAPPVTWGERLFLNGAELDLERSLGPMQLTATSNKSGRKIDLVEYGCAAYRFAAIEPDSVAPGSSGWGTGAFQSGPRQVIAAGAKVFWPDGSEAGETTLELDTPLEVERAGGRRCFGFSLRPLAKGQKGELQLCFDAASVVVRQPPSRDGGR